MSLVPGNTLPENKGKTNRSTSGLARSFEIAASFRGSQAGYHKRLCANNRSQRTVEPWQGKSTSIHGSSLAAISKGREKEKNVNTPSKISTLWQGSFFQPYLPLQQIDILSSPETHSFVAGTTNQIFFRPKNDTNIDVLVNVSQSVIRLLLMHTGRWWITWPRSKRVH